MNPLALLQNALAADAYGRRLLMPGAQPPLTATAPSPSSRQVCQCLNVTEAAITAHMQRSCGSDNERLAKLQTALQCGTQCGSCVPELKRLLRATAASALGPPPFPVESI